jgi:hypothetical protein
MGDIQKILDSKWLTFHNSFYYYLYNIVISILKTHTRDHPFKTLEIKPCGLVSRIRDVEAF